MGKRKVIRDVVTVCAAVAAIVTLAGCDGPLRLPFTTVDRPEFTNPVDPESPIPIEQILPLIPDAAFRNAVENTGAVYNTDIDWLSISLIDGITSIEGVQYLPRLTDFSVDAGGGGSLDFSPLSGHAVLRWLGAFGFSASDIRTITDIPPLEGLDLNGTVGAITLDDIRISTIAELTVNGTNLTTLDGIERFSRLRRLEIGAGVPETEFSKLQSVAGTLETLRIGVEPANLAFLGTLPNLSRFGLPATDLTNTLMSDIAVYGPFVGLSFDVSTIPGTLATLSSTGISELRISAGGSAVVDLTQLSTISLRRLDVDNTSGAITGINTLSTDIEELSLINVFLIDGNLDTIASRFTQLRRLDVSENAFTTLNPLSVYSGVMSNLEELSVRNDNTISTDKLTNGIPELAQLPNLYYVNLTGTAVGANPTTLGITDLINNTNGRVFVEYP